MPSGVGAVLADGTTEGAPVAVVTVGASAALAMGGSGAGEVAGQPMSAAMVLMRESLIQVFIRSPNLRRRPRRFRLGLEYPSYQGAKP